MMDQRQSMANAEPATLLWLFLRRPIAVTLFVVSLGVTATAQEADISSLPQLDEGFADEFDSRIVDAGEIDIHVVTGGSGPAVLLLAGWPQSWYAWRHIMPALAEEFEPHILAL